MGTFPFGLRMVFKFDEGEGEIEEALKALYFECNSTDLLVPSQDFNELYKLCDGSKLRQRQDYAYLAASLLARAQEIKKSDQIINIRLAQLKSYFSRHFMN